MKKAQVSWVESLCEEFSDWVLYDSHYKSIIVNIDEEYIKILKAELIKFGFTLIHVSYFKESVTCVFMHMKKFS